MTTWQPIRPFGIDNGELDHLERHECFTLGYELCRIDKAAESPEAYVAPVRKDNQDRIRFVLGQHNRKFTLTYMHGDVSENWMWLTIEAV
jgi:hypothetical protein